MQGPYPPDPSRQPRDPSAPAGRPPLKDWQKNTWFGPAPADMNPFDEADEAPELAELRSENVSRKAGDFWKEQEPTGYIPRTDDRQRGSMTREAARKKVRRTKKLTLRTALLLLLVPLAEHDADAADVLLPLFPRNPAADGGLAPVRRQDTCQDLDGGGFAGAVWTDIAYKLTFFDRK